MLLHQCVTLVIDHELTQSAIQVAVRKVRGRVWARRVEYDAQYEVHFRIFAEHISTISLTPVRNDLSCIGMHEDWRRVFADDTARRLRAGFSSALHRCFPALTRAETDMDLDGFVDFFARHVCSEMADAAPAVGFVRDALWGIANVTSQVSRFVAGDLDPMLLVDPSIFTPLRPLPQIRVRPFSRSQNVN